MDLTEAFEVSELDFGAWASTGAPASRAVPESKAEASLRPNSTGGRRAPRGGIRKWLQSLPRRPRDPRECDIAVASLAARQDEVQVADLQAGSTR